MLNICGCLVHTTPEMTDSVIAAIDRVEGGEVHAHDQGRIVVTVEDTRKSAPPNRSWPCTRSPVF